MKTFFGPLLSRALADNIHTGMLIHILMNVLLLLLLLFVQWLYR